MKHVKTTSNDPRWEALRAAQQARHGAAMEYIRRQVEPGTEYANEIARMVLSDSGAYFELHELPEEFVGAVGDGVVHRLVAEAEAHDLLLRLRVLVEDIAQGRFAPRALSLYLLYAGGNLRTQQGMFVFDYPNSGATPLTHGAWETGLPRALKLRLQLAPGQEPLPGLPHSGIVLFLLPAHTDGGQCLFATITRSPETRDLSALPSTPSRMAN